MPSFPSRPFPVSERLRVANVKASFTIRFVTRCILESDPWSIIRREDNKGIFRESGLFEYFTYPSNTVINLLHNIAQQTSPGFAKELITSVNSKVRHVERNVSKERIRLVSFYE